jgi:hypothetical protein
LDDKLKFIRAIADIHRFYSSIIFEMNSIGLKTSAKVTSILQFQPSDPLSFTIEIPKPVDSEDISKEIRVFKQNIGLLGVTEDVVSGEMRKPSRQGYLWKRSRGPRKNWSRRFCYIKNNQLWTKSGNSNSLLIENLLICTFTECEIDDRPFAFECSWGGNQAGTSGGSVSTIYFQAEGELELKLWLMKFQELKSSAGGTRQLQNVEMQSEMPSTFGQHGKAFSFDDLQEHTRMISDSTNSLAFGNESVTMTRTNESDQAMTPPRQRAHDPSTSATSEITITGLLAMKEQKSGRRPSLAVRDFSHLLWRTSTFTVIDSKLLTVQSHALNTQKDVVDLRRQVMNRHYIQDCDESLFNRKYVFCITCTNGQKYYFAAQSNNERQRWVQTLKLACHGWHHGADGLPYRVFRSLSLRLIEARNLSGEIYCEIYIGSDVKARTPSRKAPEHFWRNDFLFTDMYSLRHGVTIIVMHQSRMRDVELGRILITQQMLKSGETEAWFPVVSDPGLMSSMFSSSSGNSGDLKIRFKYEEEVVLSIDQYQPLIDILDVSNPIVYDLANAASDLEAISSLLLFIHDSKVFSSKKKFDNQVIEAIINSCL